MNKDVMFSTGSDCWETPDDLFQRYDDIYHFILDAAANEVNHKCPLWLGPGGVYEDALAVSWFTWLEQGNIWLNPPYSKKLQPQFVRKAAWESWTVTGNKIVCLLPARTDTKLYHEIIAPNASVEFLKGRVKFKGAAAGAPFPSMIAIFG